MSRKFSLMATALVIGAAGMAAANAESTQTVETEIARIDICQIVRGDLDGACLSASCIAFDIARKHLAHMQKSVGPTVPVGCQQRA